MLAYQLQQSVRVNSEVTRCLNTLPISEAMLAGGPDQGGSQRQVTPQVVDVPLADKCIGQIVLDWEFIHDLDVHLLKVATAQQISYPRNGLVQEPQPEPESLGSGSFDVCLQELVSPITNELRLKSGQRLEQIVWYGNKAFNPTGASTPQAVLQLDRNAAVHSIKPVENLYLTKELDAGIYVVGVHNYSQHQLNDNVIGTSAGHTYHSFEEFKKKDPGYQMMEKALNEQLLHADDPDGTPEKLAIMTRVDQEMAQGSQIMQRNCCTGDGKYGIHYGAMIYTYPAHASNHPQTCTVEELQSDFSAEMFASSDCIFNPETAHGAYNGANVLAEVATEEGKFALSHSQAAHVALIKVARDKTNDSAKIVEVKMLRGMPKNGGITACDAEDGSVRAGEMSAMNQFRSLIGNWRHVMPQEQQLSPQPQVHSASGISQEPPPMRMVQQSAQWQPEIEPTLMQQMPQTQQLRPPVARASSSMNASGSVRRQVMPQQQQVGSQPRVYSASGISQEPPMRMLQQSAQRQSQMDLAFTQQMPQAQQLRPPVAIASSSMVASGSARRQVMPQQQQMSSPPHVYNASGISQEPPMRMLQQSAQRQPQIDPPFTQQIPQAQQSWPRNAIAPSSMPASRAASLQICA